MCFRWMLFFVFSTLVCIGTGRAQGHNVLRSHALRCRVAATIPIYCWRVDWCVCALCGASPPIPWQHVGLSRTGGRAAYGAEEAQRRSNGVLQRTQQGRAGVASGPAWLSSLLEERGVLVEEVGRQRVRSHDAGSSSSTYSEAHSDCRRGFGVGRFEVNVLVLSCDQRCPLALRKVSSYPRTETGLDSL